MQSKSFGKNILRGIGSRFQKWTSSPGQKVNLGPVRRIYYKHLVPGKPRIHSVFGKQLHFISATEMMHGLEEIFQEEIYKQKFPARPYIIDCGANIGLSIIYFKQVSPDAEIVAFEPDEINFELLKNNIASFGLKDIVPRKEAVWNKNEILHFSASGSMASKLTNEPGSDTIPVQATRLRDLLTRKIDFLKIDIEGAEYPVVMDILDSLHWVNNFFLEYHGSFSQNRELNEMLTAVVGRGFEYYIKEAAPVYPTPFVREGVVKGSYDVQLNIFFFRPAKA